MYNVVARRYHNAEHLLGKAGHILYRNLRIGVLAGDAVVVDAATDMLSGNTHIYYLDI